MVGPIPPLGKHMILPVDAWSSVCYGVSMQSLHVDRPNMPDLQFVLMMLALCTSNLPTLNIPEPVQHKIFDRCWSFLHESPPPTDPAERVLDLREGTEVTLEAMVNTIRDLLTEANIAEVTWDHQPSEPTQSSTPQANPLIDRLQKLYPDPPDIADRPPSGEGHA